jgi:hypothetical protein
MKKISVALTFALLLGATTASAQTGTTIPATDTRWQPWIGCWQLLDERVRNDSDITANELAAATAPARLQRSDANTRVCVAPAARGVTITTLIGTERALEDTILADAVSHPMTDAECRGSKRSEWSKTGLRLYTSAEIACADQAPRKVSGLTMMLPGPTWMDIQLIDIEGRKNVRVRKFQRAPGQPSSVRSGSAAPFVGETSWSVADVKEASAKLMPEAVQAAIVELGTGFNVKSKQLAELSQAGVAGNVIDLMIALSYPKHFVVDRLVNRSPSPYGYGGYSGFGDLGDYGGGWPWIADAMFWPSYYSPFAYRYWGSYDPYYVPSSGYVVIEPPRPGTSPGPVASGEGRVVDGRGYTRISTRSPDPVRMNNGGSDSNGTASSNGSSGSSGGGNVSSGGYSGGGSSGGDGGRTAVPRPPGN